MLFWGGSQEDIEHFLFFIIFETEFCISDACVCLARAAGPCASPRLRAPEIRESSSQSQRGTETETVTVPEQSGFIRSVAAVCSLISGFNRVIPEFNAQERAGPLDKCVRIAHISLLT